MAHVNVSSSVLSIIASFSNGLEVLKKLRRSRKKSATKRPKPSAKRSEEDAMRLSRSLRRGPEEIGREYQASNMRCDGERYAVGDAAAQTCLAEILLKLNTGLVSIITSFLNHNNAKDGADVDFKSLTDMSEHSRLQTIGVLRQLFQRLLSRTIPSSLPKTHSSRMNQQTKPQQGSSHRDPSSRQKHTKIRHQTLARVLIENSSIPSQIALVRPSEGRKQRSSKASSRSSSEPPHQHRRLSPATSVPNLAPPPYYPEPPQQHQQQQQQQQQQGLPSPLATAPTKAPRHQNSSTSLHHNKPQSHSKGGLKYKPSSQLAIANPPPPPPPLNGTPLSTIPQRLRPETLYSLASARTGSTKLGEIPMHKWAEGPWDFEAAEAANRKALEDGWPGGCDGVEKKKKGGWKRWFGRRVEAG